ncbi:MAG TPA: DUF4397 domain-containing protein [Acidimicrobiales bacterium]|nr:DUF4397 domain-containing protein [Acidimicrobiales bacterium]
MAAGTAGAGTALAAPAATGWLRIGHFAGGIPAADVYVDGRVVATNIGFEQVTPYAQVGVGAHAVALRSAGAPASAAPVASAAPSITANSAATVAVVTNQAGLSASVYQDDLGPPPSGNAKVRVIDAVGSMPAVDVYVAPAAQPGPTQINAVAVTPADSPAFPALAFSSASPYANLPAGSYDVQFRGVGSGPVVLSAHSWPVQAGTVASVVLFSTPQGVTLEVLRDAAGPAATPAGAMRTGAGGMAHQHGGPPMVFLALSAVLLAMGAALGIGMRSRARPVKGGADTVSLLRDP